MCSAFFSISNDRANLAHAKSIPQAAPDPKEGLRVWLEAPLETGMADQRSLEFFQHRQRSFNVFEALPNMKFFHYADYKRDLRGNFTRIATALSIDVDPDKFIELSEASTFVNMQSRPKTSAPTFEMGIWKDGTTFFKKGENAQWAGMVDEELLNPYGQRMSVLISPHDQQWLENGASE
jgi:hypothetical protein